MINKKLMLISLFLLFSICVYGEEAPVYVKNIIGKPNMSYFKEEMITAKKLGINLKYNFKGCNLKLGEKYSNKEIEENKKADAYYKKKLGKDWKEKLEKETKARIKAKHRISK